MGVTVRIPYAAGHQSRRRAHRTEVSNGHAAMYRMTHERCLTSSGLAQLGLPRNFCARGSAMGRGRAKAKQTKVARELKYHSPNTDLAALQRELASSRSDDGATAEYDEYLEADDSDDDDDDEPAEDDHGQWAARR